MPSPQRKSPPLGKAGGAGFKAHGHSTPDAREVKARLEGLYLEAIAALCPQASRLLGRAGQHDPCPLCGGKDRARFFADVAITGGFLCHHCAPESVQRIDTIMHLNGWTLTEALREAAAWLGMSGEAPTVPRKAPAIITTAKSTPAPDMGALRRIRELWAGTLPAEHPAAEPMRLYLARRGLGGLAVPEVLRFAPALPYHVHEGDRFVEVGRFPAMVARIDAPDGSIIGCHRFYLTPDGNKIAIERGGLRLDFRKQTRSPWPGATKGAAVRLFPAGDVLAVAEGVETALAFHLITGLRTWATLNAGNLERVSVPDQVREVVIAADHDARGKKAALVLARRLEQEGRGQARIALPPTPGTDWNDTILKRGVRHGA